MKGIQKRGEGLFGGRQGPQGATGVRVGAGHPEAGRAPLPPQGPRYLRSQAATSCLSGLPPAVPPRQPSSAAQLIPAATAMCPGHFLR